MILKNLTQKKKTKHTPSGYSLFMHCSFDPTELHSMELHSAKNKLDCYKGKDCILYTSILYHKVKDHCHYTGKFRGAARSICNVRYKTPKEIPVVFHNGCTYDYHFIINQLAKKI